MLSPFSINNKQLSLSRFPVVQTNRSLQAWDAADEYLINYVKEQQLLAFDETNHQQTAKKVLIFNDSFGALALSCSANKVTTVSDSFISQQGLLYNLHNQQQNQLIEPLNKNNITFINSLAALPEQADVILYKIPKSKALLIEQLIKINAIANSNTRFIAAARAKDIHTSTLNLFEKYLGATTTSLAVKKARLVFSQIDKKLAQQPPAAMCWSLENTSFTICNHANVFAREKLDLGARFFLQHLPQSLPKNAQVIDLGCGNGVIGLSLLSTQAQYIQQLHFIDESFMAIASAQQNVQNNLPEFKEKCLFSANDCLTNITPNSIDLILCNPPFHQQQAVTDHIAWQMFKDSAKVLKKGGELRIIGNRQLGYHVKLKRLFKQTKLIASNKKFVIISAIK